MIDTTAPFVEVHEGISVVRDDLYVGGTKARYADVLWDGVEHCVYATPAQGGAQVALAVVAKRLGKRLSLFVARRRMWHARTHQAAALGANIHDVVPGYLTVVQKRARDFAESNGYRLVPFGMKIPEALRCLIETAENLNEEYAQVWCAAGSGTLARALCAAFPYAQVHAVSVGHKLKQDDVGTAKIHVYKGAFSRRAKVRAPFDCDPTYEEKAWEICLKKRTTTGKVLFWNVAASDMTKTMQS